MDVKIRRLSHVLAAEVAGIELSQPLQGSVLHQLKQALLDHCVLLIRGQSIDRERFIEFSRAFGELSTNQGNPQGGHPEISLIVNRPSPKGGEPSADFAGSDWHSDRSHSVSPYTISLLRAVQIPEIGGDTQFANMYRAYEALSPRMKGLLKDLDGVHIQEEKALDHSSIESLDVSRKAKTVAHAIVRTHPETGWQSLYVGDKLMLIAGMTAEESRSIVNFLRKHTRRPQFVYRHRWETNDVLIWDNRCTNHNAIGDYDRSSQMRVMEKTAVIGPVTGVLYDDPTHSRNMSLPIL